LVHRAETFLGRQVLLEHVRGILDLAATGASQVAAEQRLQHQHQRVALAALDLQRQDVRGDRPHLRNRNTHAVKTSLELKSCQLSAVSRQPSAIRERMSCQLSAVSDCRQRFAVSYQLSAIRERNSCQLSAVSDLPSASAVSDLPSASAVSDLLFASAVSYQPSAIRERMSCQLSAISYQPSAICRQLQPSAIRERMSC